MSPPDRDVSIHLGQVVYNKSPGKNEVGLCVDREMSKQWLWVWRTFFCVSIK